MDPLGLIELSIGMILTIREMAKGAEENKGKCNELASRLNRLLEVLQLPNLREQLIGKQPPGVLLELQDILNESQEYVLKWGNKSAVKKFFSWQSIQEDFKELNQRITQAVNDLNLLLTAQLHLSIKETPVVPPKEKKTSFGIAMEDSANFF